MADNPQVRAGTAGGTITVAADEVTIYGSLAQIQSVKIHDGAEGGTVGAQVTAAGELVTHQANSGTVSIDGTVPVTLAQAGTVALTGTPSVFVTNPGTVVASDLDIRNLSAAQDSVAAAQSGSWNVGGTVAVAGTVSTLERGGTVIVGGTSLVHQVNDGTVSVSSLPTVTVQATDLDVRPLDSAADSVAAVQSGAWNMGGTVTVAGTVPVRLTTAGTVSVSGAVDTELTTADLDSGAGTDTRAVVGLVGSKSGGAALIPGDATAGLKVDLGGDNDVVVTSGTVTVSGTPTVDTELTTADLDTGGGTDTRAVVGLARAESGGAVLVGSANPLPVSAVQSGAWNMGGTVNVAGTVPVTVSGTALVQLATAGTVAITGTVNAAQSGPWNVGGTVTKGSAVMGLGYVLGGTQITLTASGTVVPAVSSKVLYVTHEAFTVQGGTITITCRNGNGGGTLWGPMQFAPTGGMAVTAPLESGGLYETAEGSAVYYELVGAGTVGGRIRWARG